MGSDDVHNTFLKNKPFQIAWTGWDEPGWLSLCFFHGEIPSPSCDGVFVSASICTIITTYVGIDPDRDRGHFVEGGKRQGRVVWPSHPLGRPFIGQQGAKSEWPRVFVSKTTARPFPYVPK